MKGPAVCFTLGAGIIIIGIFVYAFTSDEKKNPGPAWIIMAIGVAIILIGLIWFIGTRQAKVKEKVEPPEAR